MIVLIVILGASASGKSTLVREFVQKHPNYRRVVTYTTRPMREGEVDGVDYHFLTPQNFSDMVRSGAFAETNRYRQWWYGTALSDCTDDLRAIAVLTPAGLRALGRRGIRTLSVYLCVDRASRLSMSLYRGDDVDEAYRRNLSDRGQFDGLEAEVTATIYNTGFALAPAQVIEKLEQILHTFTEEVPDE